LTREVISAGVYIIHRKHHWGDWIEVVQVRGQWWALVNRVMNLRVS
jgi:hypothetical protein